MEICVVFPIQCKVRDGAGVCGDIVGDGGMVMIGTGDDARECVLCVDVWVMVEEDVFQQASMSSNNSSGSIIAQREEASVLSA